VGRSATRSCRRRRRSSRRGGGRWADVEHSRHVVAAARSDRAGRRGHSRGHSSGCHVSQFVERDQMRLPGWYGQCASCRRREPLIQAPHRRRGCAFLQPVRLSSLTMEVNGYRSRGVFVVDGFYNCCSAADAEWASAQLCAEPVPA